MKGILIVDMPHSMCRQCIFLECMTLNHIVQYWCGAERLTVENPNVIQDFCPLRPLPQMPYGLQFEECDGWIACIKAITGEEENGND